MVLVQGHVIVTFHHLPLPSRGSYQQNRSTVTRQLFVYTQSSIAVRLICAAGRGGGVAGDQGVYRKGGRWKEVWRKKGSENGKFCQ